MHAAGYAIAAAVAVFYFLQHATLAPNHTDGGLFLTYIETMANGGLPHHDFVDAYGPLNWFLPVIFYVVLGELAWAVVICTIVVKLVTVWLTYELVRRAGGALFAIAAAVMMLALLGQPWQLLQTAYASVNVMPFLFGAWLVLIYEPFSRKTSLTVSALLTAGAIWVKLNTGMFLFAGGLFYCFYWLPVRGSQKSASVDERWRTPFRLARIVGLLAYGGLFFGFIWEFLNGWFLAYLGVPLVILLTWTYWQTCGDDRVDVRQHVRAWLHYLAVTVLASVAVLLGYYGPSGTLQYLSELGGILTSIDYYVPFVGLGEPSVYMGFNESYWPQLPWLLTIAYVGWIAAQASRAKEVFGDEWQKRRARTTGLFAFATLHGFVLYSRADVTHVFQALVEAPPVLFIILFELTRMLARNREALVRRAGAGALAATAAWCATLMYTPSLSALRPEDGDWQNPKLRFLRYIQEDDPTLHGAFRTLRPWDIAVDHTSRYVDHLTKDGERMLILTQNRLLHYASNTVPASSRHHYYFYLVSVGLIDRDAFLSLVPSHVLEDLFRDPPLIMVASTTSNPIAEQLPELLQLRKAAYVKINHINDFEIYALKTSELAVREWRRPSDWGPHLRVR